MITVFAIDIRALVWDAETIPANPTRYRSLAGQVVEMLETLEAHIKESKKNLQSRPDFSERTFILFDQLLWNAIMESFPYDETYDGYTDFVNTVLSFFGKHRNLFSPFLVSSGSVTSDPVLNAPHFPEALRVQIQYKLHTMHAWQHHTHEIICLTAADVWPAGTTTLSITAGGSEKRITALPAGGATSIGKEIKRVRRFEPNPKHSPGSRGNVSPLLTTDARAQALLQFAIGESIRELFYWDDEIARFIVFKQTHPGKSVYHAYNPEAPDEVPGAIRARLVR